MELNITGCLRLVEAMFRHARQEAERGDADAQAWLNGPDAQRWLRVVEQTACPAVSGIGLALAATA